MQIKGAIDNPSTASTESPPADVSVHVDSAPRSAARVQRDGASLIAKPIRHGLWSRLPPDESNRGIAAGESRTRPSAISLRIIVPPPLDARVQPALN
jgi:hypothetical protein